MKKRSKFRTIMCLLLAVLLVIPVTALDIFTGTEEELELQKIPNELNNVLESVFFSLGKTENQFEELNISQYFLDSEENTSYQYLAKRAEYYMSFRPKIFDPVVDLKQKIELVHCESVIGGYTLELIHTAEFSYHMKKRTR